MKRPGFFSLVYREWVQMRRTAIRSMVSFVALIILSLLIELSLFYGNLSRLDPSVIDGIKQQISGILISLMAVVGGIIMFSVSKSTQCDCSETWRMFRLSSPVTPLRFACAKYFIIIIAAVFLYGFNFLYAYIVTAINGTELDKENLGIMLIMFSAMVLYSVLFDCALMRFHHYDKAGGFTVICLFVLIMPFMIISLIYQDDAQMMDKIFNIFIDAYWVFLFLPFVIIGAGFIASIQLLKRREE